MNKKFYVTTPIYYATAKPHLGTLYSTLLADVAARWNKLQGKDVFFLTGTDEHGQKIAAAAEAVGKKPKEFVDSFIEAYKNVWKDYQIDYTKFIRTTDEDHKKAVQQWLSKLIESGDIYKGRYEGMYCTPCETFLVESDDSEDCLVCRRSCVLVSEEAYFFRLSNYQEKLLKFYKEHPDFVFPKNRLNEAIKFVEGGLKDLCISRSTISWGIPFPGDDAHVTYVWADALNNYITAIGYLDETKKTEFEKWWPADLQVLGKDIFRFHAVYWPAFLMASKLPLPKHLLVHGWIKIGDQKMSKSLGNSVDPVALQQEFGVDEVRYYLISQLAVTHDSEFSISGLKEHISRDLANDLGNLLNRTVTLALQNNLSVIEVPKHFSMESENLKKELSITYKQFASYMNEVSFHMACSELWKFIAKVNQYFHASEPWKLKNDKEKFQEVIFVSCSSIRAIANLLQPVMPNKTEQLLASIGAKLDLSKIEDWNSSFKLQLDKPLFKKFDKEEMEEKKEQLEKPEQISIEDFIKVGLTVGTIVECEEVADSDKLLKLTVDFGTKGTRQIIAGMKKVFSCQQLKGQQGVFVLGLKPRKMAGLESQGMMLSVDGIDGEIIRIVPAKTVAAGTILK